MHEKLFNLFNRYQKFGREEVERKIISILSHNELSSKEDYLFLYDKSNSESIKYTIISTMPIKMLLSAIFNKEFDDIYKNTNIMKRLEDENFNSDQINLLLQTDNEYIRKFAVKKADLDEIIHLAINEKNEIVIDEIIKRMKEEKLNITDCNMHKYNMLLSAKSWRIRQYVISFIPLGKIIPALLTEESKEVIESALIRLSSEELSNSQIAMLFKSVSIEFISFALKKANIETIIDVALIEDRYGIIGLIEDKLENVNISIANADILLEAKHYVIRSFAVKIASLENILKLVFKETEHDVLHSIRERLYKENLSQNQMELLTKSKSKEIQLYLVTVLPLDSLISFSQTIEVDYNNIVFDIMEILEKQKRKITVEQFDKLTTVDASYIQEFAIPNCSKKSLIRLAKVNENYYIFEELIKRLENEKLTKLEYKKLLYSKLRHMRSFAVEKAEIDYVLELAYIEENESVAYNIVKRLKYATLESFQKRMLLNAKSPYIRSYAVTIVDIDDVYELITTEKDNEVLSKIKERLKFEKIINDLGL